MIYLADPIHGKNLSAGLKVKISDGTKHYINENNASKFIPEKELKQFESDIEWLRLYWATGGKVDKEN